MPRIRGWSESSRRCPLDPAGRLLAADSFIPQEAGKYLAFQVDQRTACIQGRIERSQGFTRGRLDREELRADPLRDQSVLPGQVQEPLEPLSTLWIPGARVVVDIHSDEPIREGRFYTAAELHGIL